MLLQNLISHYYVYYNFPLNVRVHINQRKVKENTGRLCKLGREEDDNLTLGSGKQRSREQVIDYLSLAI